MKTNSCPMNYYQEINFRPDAEVSTRFILEKTYAQLHLALAEYQSQRDAFDIGVAFPQYNLNEADASQTALGAQLRIIGSSMESLAQLNLRTWLSRFSDYAPLSEIQQCPPPTYYATFTRTRPQSQSGYRRMVRRKMERDGITEEEACASFSGKLTTKSSAPHVYLQSLSNEQRYPLFIQKTEVEAPVAGTFNSYGLSQQGATVPMF